MVRARTPNIAADGTNWLWEGYDNVPTTSSAPGYTWFSFLDRAKAEAWAPAAARGDLWLHGFFLLDWRDTFIKVSSILQNANASEGYNVTRDPTTPPQMGFNPGFRFYAVGALELLDAPGEFHLDNRTGVLHFLPPKPLTATTDIEVSVLDTVVVAGSDYTTFEGLTISVARKGPALTTCGNPRDYYNFGRCKGALGEHVSVVRSTISNSGGR